MLQTQAATSNIKIRKRNIVSLVEAVEAKEKKLKTGEKKKGKTEGRKMKKGGKKKGNP